MKEKNKYGQYFTIDSIARFMVDLIGHNRDAKVLEPSSGKGVFLDALLEAGFTNVNAYEIDQDLDTRHSFVKNESFISAPLDPYDVVIGNPPYIRWKNLEKELKEELSTSPLWNKYFNSLCDYLFIFILKSICHLTDGGELIFICTEYWMNTTNSRSLRDFMTSNGFVSEIYHFKEAPLFEGVCASFIIFRYVKGGKAKKQIDLYRYDGTGQPSYEELKKAQYFTHEYIPQFESGSRWLLATREQQELLSSFEEACSLESKDLFAEPVIKRIGEFCDIGNGMVSGLDKAFNMTGEEGFNENERQCMIKVLKAKDLDHYTYHSESQYFFIRDSISGDSFSKSFPVVNRHMAPYLKDLEQRYNYGKDIPYWEFVFPRNLSLFSRPEKRIMVPCKERISNKDHFRFVLAGPGYYPLQDVTCILRKDNCRESIEYLLAYLNNERVFKWLSYNGIVKGYIVEFSEAPIASIPYRSINWDQEREVKIHEAITEAVNHFIETRDETYLNIINQNFNYLFHG